MKTGKINPLLVISYDCKSNKYNNVCVNKFIVWRFYVETLDVYGATDFNSRVIKHLWRERKMRQKCCRNLRMKLENKSMNWVISDVKCGLCGGWGRFEGIKELWEIDEMLWDVDCKFIEILKVSALFVDYSKDCRISKFQNFRTKTHSSFKILNF